MNDKLLRAAKALLNGENVYAMFACMLSHLFMNQSFCMEHQVRNNDTNNKYSSSARE